MIKALQQIYKNHGLAYDEHILGEETVDLKPYQPDVQAVLKKVTAQTWKRRWTRNVIDGFCLFTFLGLMYDSKRLAAPVYG
jgi:hypothetical protein